MKRTFCIFLAVLAAVSAFFYGCEGKKENTVRFVSCEVRARVESVNGKELTVAFLNGMREGEGIPGDGMTPPDGELPPMPEGEIGEGPGGKMEGELPGLPEGETGGIPGEPSSFPEPGPGGEAGVNTITGILTIGDNSALRKTQNGADVSADLTEVTVGTVLTVTFDPSGSVTVIRITEDLLPEQGDFR